MGKILITYSIGVVISVVSTILANYYSANDTALIITFAGFVPLAILLITDRLSVYLGSEDLKSEWKKDSDANKAVIIEAVNKINLEARSCVQFKNDEAWIKYIEENAEKAENIYNMRISAPGTGLEREQARIDIAIAKAVKRGANYYFIYSSKRDGEINTIIDRFKNTKARNKGIVRFYSYDPGDNIALQIKLFEFSDRLVALMGFVYKDAINTNQPTFLITSRELASYFLVLFRYHADKGNENTRVTAEIGNPP